MPTAVKTCRVCGKSYEACRTLSRAVGVFRWQEVACSPACGAEYLRRIAAARDPASTAQKRGARRKEAGDAAAVRNAEVERSKKDSEASEAPVDEM